jgi:hypothetical protein
MGRVLRPGCGPFSAVFGLTLLEIPLQSTVWPSGNQQHQQHHGHAPLWHPQPAMAAMPCLATRYLCVAVVLVARKRPILPTTRALGQTTAALHGL